MTKTPVQPVITAPLLAEMREELLRVLASLSDEQWQMHTACEGWNVKDVALHVLSDDMNLLSGLRDKDGEWSDLQNWDELVAWINARNDLWVRATRRISKRLLVQMLRFTGEMVGEYFLSLNSEDASGVAVSWAGDDEAAIWLEIAREYTEYWMHHQHICEGAGITSLKTRPYLHPVIDIFLRALPHTYRNVQATENTLITITTTGEAADSWHLLRESENWKLYAEIDAEPDCHITLPDDITWRLLTKGISGEAAKIQSSITGDETLAEPFFEMVSIIA